MKYLLVFRMKKDFLPDAFFGGGCQVEMVMERPNRYATDTPWAAVCCSVSAALPLAGSVVWPLAQECMELAPKDGFTPPCHLEAAKSVPRTCSVPSFPSLLRVFPGFPLMLAESPLPLSFLFTLAVFLQRISCCTHCIIGALSLQEPCLPGHRLQHQDSQGIFAPQDPGQRVACGIAREILRKT